MNLLDATLAFALTMGALATVATVMMEAFHRAIRIRRRNLVDVFKRLNRELDWLDEGERWEFVVRVLNNPAARGHALPERAGARDCQSALDGLGFLDLRRGVYDAVSVEHVMRRLAELPTVRAMIETQRSQVEAELDRVARRYQEIRSGVSADFKRRAQLWSMVAGILLAIFANIDGARVFDAYKNDRALSAKIIAKQDEFEQAWKSVEAEKASFETATAERDAARENLARAQAAPDEAAIKAAETALAEAERKLVGLADKEPATDVSVGDLATAGVPIGPSYWPWGDLDAPAEPGASAFLQWVVKVLLTGLLLGLGAPFWFDVATRLAQVRTAMGGRPSAEVRMAGQEAVPDAAPRRRLVSEIVDDALSDAQTSARLRPPDETICHLQTLLRSLGFLETFGHGDAVREVGVVGSRTRAAVERFLADQGITGEIRAATVGDWNSPDFVPTLIGLLDDARAA